MGKEKKEDVSCGVAFASGCCKIEALVRVDDRGQIVLPKDLRERAGIKAGDKLVVVTSEKGEKVCCLILMPARDLRESIRKTFGPLLGELVK